MSRHRKNDTRTPLWRIGAALLSAFAMVAAMAVTSATANADPEGDESGTNYGTPAVNKVLIGDEVVGEGVPFEYQIFYSCNGIRYDCVGAVLTDTLPAGLQFVTTPADIHTTQPSNITIDGNVLKVVFQETTQGNTVGLKAGPTNSFKIRVKSNDGMAIGDTTLTNTVRIESGGGKSDEATADVTVHVDKVRSITLTKDYVEPHSGENAIVNRGYQGTGATSTVKLTATVAGNQPASELTITDPTDGTNPFESLDLTDFKTLTIPDSVEATITVTTTSGSYVLGQYGKNDTPQLTGNLTFCSDNAANVCGEKVIGVSVTFVPAAPATDIAVGTNLTIQFGVKMRTHTRSNSAKLVQPGQVDNTGSATASYADGNSAGPISASAPYQIIGASAITPIKTITPDSAVITTDGYYAGSQTSPDGNITMTAGATNSGIVTASELTVVDGLGDKTSAFDWSQYFTFKEFNALNLPEGITAHISVWDGASWTPLKTAGYTLTDLPSLSDAGVPSPPSAANVKGIMWVYSGSIDAGVTLSNSFETTLKKNAVNSFDQSFAANCAYASMKTDYGTSSRTQDVCDYFTATKPSVSVGADKTFSSNSGYASTTKPPITTVTITGTNTSDSTAPAMTTFMIQEPQSNSTSNKATFQNFTFTEFRAIDAPNNTTWNVYVTADDNLVESNWKPLSNNPVSSSGTPDVDNLPAGITADAVKGIRWVLANDSTAPIKATETVKASFDLKMKSPIDFGSNNSKSVKNCALIQNTSSVTKSDCDTYTINKITDSGISGISKTLDVTGSGTSIVERTSGEIKVTLNGRNQANVEANKITLTDQNMTDKSATFWDWFDFEKFTSVKYPAGTTNIQLNYYSSSTWTAGPSKTISGGNSGTWTLGAETPTIPSEATGIQVVLDGSFAAKATAVAVFYVTLDSTRTATSDTVVANCFKNSSEGPLFAAISAVPACPTVTIEKQAYKLTQTKTLSDSVGIIQSGSTTDASLSVTNASNIDGLISMSIDEPSTKKSDGSTDLDNPFKYFKLTNIKNLTIPANMKVTITVQGSSSLATLGPITDSGAVNWPDSFLIAKDDVVGLNFKFEMADGSAISRGASASVVLTLALLDTIRGASTPVVEPPATNRSIENCVVSEGKAGNGSVVGGYACKTYQARGRYIGVTAQKTWGGSEFRDKPTPSSMTLGAVNNTGTLALDTLTIVDPAPVGSSAAPPSVVDTAFNYYNVTGFGALILPTGANQVQLDVLADTSSAQCSTDVVDGWCVGTPAGALPDTTDGKVNGIPLDDVVGIRATFSNSDPAVKLPVVTEASDGGSIDVGVSLRSLQRANGNPIEVTPGTSKQVSNVVQAIGILDQSSASTTASATHGIMGGSIIVAPEKKVYPDASKTQVQPNQNVQFQLQLTNTGKRKLVEPTVIENLGDNLSFSISGDNYSLDVPAATTESTLNATDLTVTPNPTTKSVTFQFTHGTYLAPGETVYLIVTLKTKSGLSAGTPITNEYGITWAGSVTYANGQTTNNGDIACTKGQKGGSPYGNRDACTDSTQLKVLSSNGLDSLKLIRGDGTPFTNVNPSLACDSVADPTDPDHGDPYTYYPCIAHTVVNGEFDYRLNVTVSGNEKYERARVIDVLPHTGDTALLDSTDQRGTEWTPTFLDAPALEVIGLPNGSYTVYYSKSSNPDLSPLSGTTNWDSSVWSTSSFGTETKAIAIDVDMGNQPELLLPGQTFTLHWWMKAPPVGPGAGSIAWNSFAYSGLAEDETRWMLPSEPYQVGIDLTNPSVQVKKVTDPVAGGEDFEFTLKGVDGATGGGTASVTTGSDGSKTSDPWLNLTNGGTYQLVESSRTDYAIGSIACYDTITENPVTTSPVTNRSGATVGVEFVAGSGMAIECAVKNIKRPQVTVTKKAVGGSGVFDFALVEGDGPATSGWHSLKASETTSESYTWGPKDLKPGTEYTLTERSIYRPIDLSWLPPNLSPDLNMYWYTKIECTVGNTTVTGSNGSVTFTTPDAGGEVSCTATNTKRPKITVLKKATDGSLAGAKSFSFTLSGPGGYTADKTAVATWLGNTPLSWLSAPAKWGPSGLEAGKYTLKENTPSDWYSTFEACYVGSGRSANDKVSTTIDRWSGEVKFKVEPGQDIECEYTNQKRPSVTVKKTAVGGSGDFYFGLVSGNLDSLLGLGLGAVQNVPASEGAAPGTYTWGPENLVPGTTYTLGEIWDGATLGSIFGVPIPDRGSLDRNWYTTFNGCTGIDQKDIRHSDDRSVTFVAGNGDNISCSFTNTKRPEIEVEKNVQGTNARQSVKFTLVGPDESSSTKSVRTNKNGVGSTSWGPKDLVAGTYTLYETVKAGEWYPTFDACYIGEGAGMVAIPDLVPTLDAIPDSDYSTYGVSFTANAGDKISCSFNNAERPKVTVHKTALGNSGDFSFTLTPVEVGEGGVTESGEGSTKSVHVDSNSSADATWNSELEPGWYKVTESAIGRWTPVFQGCYYTDSLDEGGAVIGENDDDLPVSLAVESENGAIFLDAGDDVTCFFQNTYNPPPPDKSYAVGDYVWIDANSNGLQDEGEQPLAGVLVTLLNESGTVIGTTNTNSAGFYLFDQLKAGKYQVRFTLTAAQAEKYSFTKQNAGGVGVDSDANPETGLTILFTLDSTNGNLTKSYAGVLATEGIDPTWDAGVIELEVAGTSSTTAPPTTTTEKPTSTSTEKPTVSGEASTEVKDNIAYTGVNTLGMGLLALLLLAGGGLLIGFAGRRRQARKH